MVGHIKHACVRASQTTGEAFVSAYISHVLNIYLSACVLLLVFLHSM